MSIENLTFANYRLDRDSLAEIYNIGANDSNLGVIPQMADTFQYQLSDEPSVDNLGGFLGEHFPAKELQQNIARIQETFGSHEAVVDLFRGWADRSGLLIPVEQSYLSGERLDQDIDLAVLSGGVRNWMERRAQRLIDLTHSRKISGVLLVAGNREMNPNTEGPGVEPGMTEAGYMKNVIAKHLSSIGISATFISVESGGGDTVMEAGAQKAKEIVTSKASIAVISNAANWVQNVGQARRALRNVFGSEFDQDGKQILAVSDSFPLGNDTEPTATHQNPLSAAGQIVRNAHELTRQY